LFPEHAEAAPGRDDEGTGAVGHCHHFTIKIIYNNKTSQNKDPREGGGEKRLILDNSPCSKISKIEYSIK